MKRRNFLKTLIGAAAAVVVPASAMRDILIHKGNLASLNLRDNPLRFAQLYYGRTAGPSFYEPKALWQINLYQHVSRISFFAARPTDVDNMCHAELEVRMLAALHKKDQELLQTLSDYEAAESWRGILPGQKRA